MSFLRLGLALIALGVLGCGRDLGPCYWDGWQARETGTVQAESLECDGVMGPLAIQAIYQPTSSPLRLELRTARDINPSIEIDASARDGSYTVEGHVGSSVPVHASDGKLPAWGGDVSGSVTFTRTHDVPFVDIDEPSARDYASSIDITFDIVASLPHPDPAMGPGCTLKTGEHHVTLVVEGPVVECTAGFHTGVH